jgi:hypothetical protein
VRWRGSLERHRTSIASSVALAVAATGVLVYALSADGYQPHDTQLNDGGIWVTNASDGFYGRINKPVGQLDAALFAKLDTSLDVVQDGGAVIGVNASDGSVAPIDPSTATHPDGDRADVPGDADVALAGGTVAVADPADGRVWATRAEPGVVPSVIPLDQQTDPLVEVGDDAAMAVTRSGRVVVVSAEKDAVTTVAPGSGGWSDPVTDDLEAEVGPEVAVTAVGDTVAVLDEGQLGVVGGGASEVPTDSVLQQTGPDAASVLVSSGSALLEVGLGSGAVDTLVEGVSGTPTAPVRLGDCVYGAWSGGRGTVATVCGDGEPQVAQLDGQATHLVFRVNRGEIVLNDRSSGRVWEIESDQPTRLDNWEDFRTPTRKDQDEDDNEKQDTGDRRPPQAKPDQFGARPGRLTVLHPLDNDAAPQGRILAIRSVDAPPGHPVTISPDGQTLQIVLPEKSAGTRFEYYVDDGRSDVSAHATVTVSARGEDDNSPPHLREHFEPHPWTVPAGGVLDVPVLPDWRDKEDGDPLSVASAQAMGGETTGASARVTSSGRIRFTAPARGGPVTMRYAVSDGLGAPVGHELRFRVLDPAEREPVAAVAEPDVVSGEVGRPITIRPLANDLPGADPVTPQAQLALAGKVVPSGGARVRTDLHEGTITVTSDIVKTYFLDYEAAYGNAPFAPGRIRVDVRPSSSPPPVAMPDTVTLRGQAASMVDVLANDVDPGGGMLVVQQATAREQNELDVAVVEGRWLRISARQGSIKPNPQVVRYTISNGDRSGVEGEVVVSQAPRPEDNTPVTEIDRVTVRAGAGVSVPVLDNDFSPSGEELGLVGHVAGEEPGQLSVQRPGDERVPTGQAFVAGRLVRYVAPAGLEEETTFTIPYLATNETGDTAPGRVEVRVVPLQQRNEPPEPPVLEGRAVSGSTVRLTLPGAGVDPDGDSVTLLGLGTPTDGAAAPRLGRVVRFGANSLEYQSYPGSQGTEEFTYLVTDTFGATATGVVRVAVVPPGPPQPPLAVNDTLTVEPGRRATVDVLANDLVAAGDRVEIELVDPPEGAELVSPVGPVLIDAAERADGRNVEVVYSVSNGLDSSRGVVTLRTSSPWNNPPVVPDAFGTSREGDVVEVDVLEAAYDPDGDPGDLVVTDVFAPQGVRASMEGSRITVARGDQPIVVPFRVEDADGAAATASLYVPASEDRLPYVLDDALIRLEPGRARDLDLRDHVADPAGGPVRFTLTDRIWASPAGDLRARIAGDGSFEVRADGGYRGPGAVAFEVTTGDSVEDPDGVRAVVSVPVQVGPAAPILRCPAEPIEVAQGESVGLDIATLCHVWTADPADAEDLAFEASWQREPDGLEVSEADGAVVEVAARGEARAGTEARLRVTADGSEPGEIALRVTRAPPPALAPIRVADMKAGEERVVDLSRYLRPGVSDPEPTLVRVEPATGLDVRATKEGDSSVRLVTGDSVAGHAEFRVVMSDVSGDSGPERRAEGRISLDVLDRPDRPRAPVPGTAVRSAEVQLGWRAPVANGAPVTAYELRTDAGSSRRCGSTSCTFPGLTNGRWYRFSVRARNAVGWSDWSAWSVRARPDEKPAAVRRLRVTGRGDGWVSLAWNRPANKTSPIEFYEVSHGGTIARPRGTSYTVRGLDNDAAYTFAVSAKNAYKYGDPVKVAGQSIGSPGSPEPVTVTPTDVAGDSTAVRVSWGQVVPPNGPGPVVYTVRKGDTPICRTQELSCVHEGIVYDGTTYAFSVTATNAGGQGDARTGAAARTSWSAVGQPASWGAWSVRPTGQNSQAVADFTVPSSRGAASNVTILVNDSPVDTFSARGAQSRTFGVPGNDGPHTVALRVCNEKSACSTSSAQQVQTYGPLEDGHVVSASAKVSGTSVSWSITVDTNGDPAAVRVTSNQGRDETYAANTVNTHSFTTPSRDIGYSSTETITVVVSDGSPSRGDGRRTFTSPSTQDPPSPVAEVYRGEKCNDANSLQDCNVDGSGVDCIHSSCGFVVVKTSNFSGTVTCRLDSSDGAWSHTWSFGANETRQLTAYFGFPNGWVEVSCSGNGSDTDRYDWPDS